MKSMDKTTAIERSIIKKYRKPIWNRFIAAVKDYELIAAGDRIAVCISGGKDSMLLAKCLQELKRHSYLDFELKFLVMDPGYAPANRAKIEANIELLGIDAEIFNSPIFEAVESVDDSPCYLCARMRRGYLYKFAQSMGCNKIALGHHFDDVIETGLMSMFYGAEIKTMMPKLHSTNFVGMELIRPLYYVHEEDIIAWRRYNGLTFLQCACRRTEQMTETGAATGKRAETKALLKQLKRDDPQIDINIFRSLHSVNLGAVPGTVQNGVRRSFIEDYDGFDRRVEYAVFDLDGTVLDSMHLWQNLGEDFLRLHGKTLPCEMHDAVNEMTVTDAIFWCNENMDLCVPVEQGLAEVTGLVQDAYANQVKAKPFAQEYLQALAASETKICAATQSDRAYIEPALSRLGLADRFSFVAYAAELGVAKQDVRFWHRIAAQLGTTTEKLTVFEDSLFAMKTAKAAGCRVVAVYDEAAKQQNDEIRSVCDFYAGSFARFVK